MKIVGNTVGTSLPKPDLRQTDPKKGDFVYGKGEIGNAVNDALAEAKASGEFKGDPGAPGKDYVLTEADKTEIAELAAEMVEVPSGGGEALSEEWTEEVLLSGVLATTDTAGMFDTGLTWADLKKYDMIQFSYDGTISGDVFIGFQRAESISQWYWAPMLFRSVLQAKGYVRIYILGGGTVAEIRISGGKATNMDITHITNVSQRDYQGIYSSNLAKLKGCINPTSLQEVFDDDSHFKIYFTKAPTADLTWYLIGGKY